MSNYYHCALELWIIVFANVSLLVTHLMTLNPRWQIFMLVLGFSLFSSAGGLRSSAKGPFHRSHFHAAQPFQTFPAYLPIPAARDRSATHHLAVRRRGAAAVPGPLHTAAERSRTTARAQQRVRTCPAQPDHLRQRSH